MWFCLSKQRISASVDGEVLYKGLFSLYLVPFFSCTISLYQSFGFFYTFHQIRSPTTG